MTLPPQSSGEPPPEVEELTGFWLWVARARAPRAFWRSLDMEDQRAFWFYLSIGLIAVTLAGSPAARAEFVAHQSLWAIVGVSTLLCIYVGFPWRHYKAPSTDSIVMAGTAGLAMVQAARALINVYQGSQPDDQALVLGHIAILFGAVVALQQTFNGAADVRAEPPNTDRPTT